MAITERVPRSERLRHGFRRLTRYRGMLVIILWQVPVGPEVRPDGSIGFMFGTGTDRLLTLGCEGNVVAAEPYDYRVAAVEVDYDVALGVRLDAAAGYIDTGRDFNQGGFGAAQLRVDNPRFGFGAGFAFKPTDVEREDADVVGAHLRLGRDERLHFRMDVNQPTALLTQQFARIGAGWNATRRDAASGFLGIAWLGSQAEVLGVAGELTLPFSPRAAARVIGHAGSRDSESVHGFALGARLLLP